MTKDLKLSFDRNELWRAFKILAVSSPVPAKKSVHQYTKLLKIELSIEGIARLSTASLFSGTTYDNLSIRWEGASPEESIELSTVFDKFYAIVQTTSRERVICVISKDRRWIKVQCEGTARLPQEMANSFPSTPEWTTPFIEGYSTDALQEAIDKVKGTICEDSSYSSIYGIFFDGSWVSCTGRYLTVHPSDYEWAGSFFVSKQMADLAPALVAYKEEVGEAAETFSVSILGSRLGIECVDVRHYVTTQAANFPDYLSIIDQVKNQATDSVNLDIPSLQAALNRIGPFIDIWGSLRIVITNDEMTIEADNPSDSENYTESIHHHGATAELDVLMRYEFLRTLISQVTELTLWFKDGNTPMYSVCNETLTVIPPMRRT